MMVCETAMDVGMSEMVAVACIWVWRKQTIPVNSVRGIFVWVSYVS